MKGIALVIRSIKDKLWTLLLRVLSPLLGVKLGKNVYIGWGTLLYGNVVLEDGVSIGRGGYFVGNIHIGSYTGIGDNARVHATKGRVVIGKYCAIGRDFLVHAQEHNYKHLIMSGRVSRLLHLPDPSLVKGDTIIGNCVWIGDRVIVTSGSRIGDGAVIGAGYVVREEVEAYTVVSHKGKKYRFPENVIEQLKRLKPCEKDLDELKHMLEEGEVKPVY